MWGTLATRICRRSSRPSLIPSGRSRLRRQDAVTDRRWRRKRPRRRRRCSHMDEVEPEEDESEPSYPPVQPAPGTVVVDISDDEE